MKEIFKDIVSLFDNASKLTDEEALIYWNDKLKVILNTDISDFDGDLLQLEIDVYNQINCARCKIDQNDTYVRLQFKTYDFFEEYIWEYLNSLTQTELCINYINFIAKEIKKILIDINVYLNNRNKLMPVGKEFQLYQRWASIFANILSTFSNENYNQNEIRFLKNEETRLKKLLEKIQVEKGYLEERIRISVTEDSKKKWMGSKKEFANFIIAEYNRNPKYYSSLRNASNKLFEQYVFDDKNWTKEQCYDMAKH